MTAVTVQPFRQEVTRVIAHYIAPGAPRELNLSHQERTRVLHALQHTTHPSAFAQLNVMIENQLRGHAHPNFVRWSICNGNKPRVFFVRTMGVSHIAMGLIIAFLFTLSSVSRWYRILSAPVLFVGISTMVAAYSGLCVILHHNHGRNVKPWEEIETMSVASSSNASNPTAASGSIRSKATDEEAVLPSSAASRASTEKRPISMDTFGSGNSFQDEPWVGKYDRKPLLRKVFDDSTWVQEEALRVIQDKIVLKANVWGLILTTLSTVVWVALPAGNFF